MMRKYACEAAVQLPIRLNALRSGLCLALLLASGLAQAAPPPSSAAPGPTPFAVPAGSILILHESETGHHGIWTFDGRTGTGSWTAPYGPAQKWADLSIVRFDGTCIDLTRRDTAGSSPGLTATYHGCVSAGHQVSGQAHWTWPGHFAGVAGVWTAELEIISPEEAFHRGETALHGPDKAVARRWFSLSASHGDQFATYPLGQMMLNGIGGPKDIDGARHMFELGVKAGRGDSAYMLAEMVEHGLAGPPDREAARRLYETSLARRFVPARTRLVQFEAEEYTPPDLSNSPDWRFNDHLLGDGTTTLHVLATQIADGPRRFVLAAECRTDGISAADGLSLSLWLLQPGHPGHPGLQLNLLKYRRQGTASNAGAPPLARRFRPDRWTLMALPADTAERLAHFANEAQWQDVWSRVGFAFGTDAAAVAVRPSALTPAEQAAAAHAVAAARMLQYYQLVFQQPAPGASPDDADLLKVEVEFGPQTDDPDLLTQSHRILTFNLNGLDAKRNQFLTEKCQMTDPYADAAVRMEQPDP